MKKVVSVAALILVALMMLAVVSACNERGGSPSEQPTEAPVLAGSYKLIEVSGEGSGVLGDIMDQVTLDIDSNGKGVMKYETTEMELQFDESTGVATGGDSSVPFTFDGTNLKLEDEYGRMTFEKK